MNTRYFGRLRVANLDSGRLDASIDAYEVGQLRVYRIDAPARRVSRDTASGELPSDKFYKLVLQVSGQGVVEQQQRRAVGIAAQPVQVFGRTPLGKIRP
ncbi:MAG: hypothetical protein ABI433_10180 [Burkholderiaceae bacterium]